MLHLPINREKSQRNNYKLFSNFCQSYFKNACLDKSKFFQNTFSKKQYDFRGGYRVPHCLFAMFEGYGAWVDNGNVFGVLLTGRPI